MMKQFAASIDNDNSLVLSCMHPNVPIYGFYPAAVVFDSESYTCDSIILLSGFECKVLLVPLSLSLSHKRPSPQSANRRDTQNGHEMWRQNDFAGEFPVSPQNEGQVAGTRMYAGYG
jgi:hypothetical protein